MKKLCAIAIGCLLLFAVIWSILRATTNHPEVFQNNATNLRTFSWQLAGIDFRPRYPANWTVMSWASSSQAISHLELISSASGTPESQPYFCVDLSIGPSSSDFYQLRGGGVTASLANGLFVYQRFLDVGGLQELQAWLTNDKLVSVLPLANGKTLFAEASYRCVGGDAEIPTLSAGQQQSSSYYAQSISILQSVASAARLARD